MDRSSLPFTVTPPTERVATLPALSVTASFSHVSIPPERSASGWAARNFVRNSSAVNSARL